MVEQLLQKWDMEILQDILYGKSHLSIIFQSVVSIYL